MKKATLFTILILSILLSFSCSSDSDDPVNENTEDVIIAEDDSTWVDLGLPSGIKWARYNVGAEKPEDYGDYFAWGETETKDYFWMSTYIFAHPGEKGRWIFDRLDDFSGNPRYDAATANWGAPARTPMLNECKELVENCKWQETTQNGVNGMLATGPNGKNLFFPYAGDFVDARLEGDGDRGSYMSSTPNESDEYMACSLSLGVLGNVEYHDESPRVLGETVRPVKN